MPAIEAEVRAKTKATFKSALKQFAKELQPAVTTAGGQWAIKGFLDVFRNVYTITADTKIVSKILEIHLFPRLLEFAAKNDYRIVLTDHQNWYPDFSFVRKDNPAVRFAVDLKTTYRNPTRDGFVNGFTLGSHGEYFQDRTSTKNIQFPYDTYYGHFCLGLIYTRTDLPSVSGAGGDEEDAGDALEEMAIYSVDELGPLSGGAPALKNRSVRTLRDIPSVMTGLQFFACEKWELASDRSGSGNTANIGSIKHIDDILNGRGVFSRLGEEVFDEYWKNYGKISVIIDGKDRKISDLRNYLAFKGRDPALAHHRAERKLKAVFATKGGNALNPRKGRRS